MPNSFSSNSARLGPTPFRYLISLSSISLMMLRRCVNIAKVYSRLPKRFAQRKGILVNFAGMNNVLYPINLLIHRIKALYLNGSGTFIDDFRINVLNDTLMNPTLKRLKTEDRSSFRIQQFYHRWILVPEAKRKVPGRTISQVTGIASVNERYGRLLYRLARNYNPSHIKNWERLPVSVLSTSLPEIRRQKSLQLKEIPHLSEVASQNFRINRIKNITVINSSFDDVLPSWLIISDRAIWYILTEIIRRKLPGGTTRHLR